MNKKGQEVFGLSFGVIFSIIIIIFIIAVSFYAIRHFLGLNECAEVGLFYEDFQEEIDNAWSSASYRKAYSESAPSGIENVCFGAVSLPAPVDASWRRLYYEFSDESPAQGTNMFLYPIEKACDGDLFAKKINHVNISKFICANVTSNKKMDVVLEFDINMDSQVRIETS